jgi:Transmembrane amino acid transporter protein
MKLVRGVSYSTALFLLVAQGTTAANNNNANRNTKHNSHPATLPVLQSVSSSIPLLRELRGGAAAAVKASGKRAAATAPKKTSPAGAATTYSDQHIAPGTAEPNDEIFNLVKSVVGAGVLGLPAGIAAFGNAPSAMVPSMLLLVSIGCLAATGFCNIGTVCRKTAATSYKQAWSRSVSPQTAWMPAVACLMVTLCTVLTFSMILADTIPSILQTVAGIAIGRTAALLGVTVLVIFPLCLLRSLSSLAPFSLLVRLIGWLVGWLPLQDHYTHLIIIFFNREFSAWCILEPP